MFECPKMYAYCQYLLDVAKSPLFFYLIPHRSHTFESNKKHTQTKSFFFLHDVEILEIIPLFSLNIFMFEKKPVLYALKF